MNQKSLTSHPAFKVFLAVCIYNFFAYGVIMNTQSTFVTPITTALDFARGDFSISITVRALCGAVGTAFVGRIMPKVKNIRIYFAILSLCFVANFLVQTLFTEIWQFVAIAVFSGLLNGLAVYSTVALILPNWFVRPSRYIGIAMAMSGVGGIIFSPVLGAIFTNFSWKGGFYFEAAMCLVILLPISLFGLRLKPEEIGAQPFASEADLAELEQDQVKAAQKQATAHLGLTLKEAMGQPVFYVSVLYFVSVAFVCGIFAQVTPVLSSKGFDTMVSSSLTSFYNAGMFVGQFFAGFLVRKLKIKNTCFIYLIGLILACIGVITIQSPIVIIFGIIAFLLGCGRIFSTVMGPTITLEAYGQKDYSKIWSTLYPFFIVPSAFVATIMGYVYDFTGSYNGVFYAMIGFIVVLALCVIYITAFSARRKNAMLGNG